MSVDRKTLVVFDTNKLRQTRADSPAYHTFSFGAEFEQLKKFIQDNELTTIDLATTRMTMAELLKQKTEQYLLDKETLSGIMCRMTTLPGANFSTIQIPGAGFDCNAHLSPKADGFLKQEKVIVIDLPEAKLADIFKRVLDRSINKKAPFFGKSDTGFKDVIIWESILHFDRVSEYDKVYLVSSDAGFDSVCKSEFESEKKVMFDIASNIQLLIESLEDDYESKIERNKYEKFTHTEYFKDHLKSVISELSTLPIKGNEYPIKDLEIVDYLDSVEVPKDKESGISAILISTVRGKALISGEEKNVHIKINTMLDEAQGIQDYGYEYSI